MIIVMTGAKEQNNTNIRGLRANPFTLETLNDIMTIMKLVKNLLGFYPFAVRSNFGGNVLRIYSAMRFH